MRRDLSLREKVVVAPLIALIVLLGFYPKPVLDVINPAVAGDHAGRRQRPTRRPTVGSVQEAGKVTPIASNARRSTQAAEPRLRGARADADPVRRGLRRRAGRGVRAPAQPRTWCSSCSRWRRWSPRWSWWSGWQRRRPADHRRRGARDRRADAVPAGHASWCSACVALLLIGERSLERGGAVRRPGRDHRRRRGATGGRPRASRGAHRGLPADHCSRSAACCSSSRRTTC